MIRHTKSHKVELEMDAYGVTLALIKMKFDHLLQNLMIQSIWSCHVNAVLHFVKRIIVTEVQKSMLE